MQGRSEDALQVEIPESLCRKLHVPVSRAKALRTKNSLTSGAIIELNQALELIIRDLIRAAFLDELESCRRNDVKFRMKPVIDGVLERFGLSEEAKSFDSVKKDLQRFCLAQEIDYSEEKKVRKAVPKIRAKCAKCAKEVNDGVPLADFIAYKGISRRTFFNKYRNSLKTFFHKGCLFVHIDAIPAEDLSFVVPYTR